MDSLWTITFIWLTSTSLAGFLLMGIDKFRAKEGYWRIPERTLVEIAVIGGAFGVLAGSRVFHHKMEKYSFLDVVLGIVIVWLTVLLSLERLLGQPFV